MSGVELWFLGQSGFRLRDLESGTTLFIDPFLSPHEGRCYPAPILPGDLSQADAVLCTHEHIDHFDQPALRAANQTDHAAFHLIVPEPLAAQARELGIPPARISGVQPEQESVIKDARVHPVPAKHGVHPADAYSMGKELSGGQVRFLGYVIELGGMRLYHAGDTLPYKGQVETLQRLDPQIALLPINGRSVFRALERDIVGNMEPREAAQLADNCGVRMVVPMHWDMFEFNRGYPNELVACVQANYPALTVLVMGRNAHFIFASQDKNGT